MNWPLLLVCLCLLGFCPHPEAGELTNATTQIGFDQNIGARIPLRLQFLDERGRANPLKTFFERKPVILVMAYYECPMLCTEVLNGLERALKALSVTAGRDFQIVIVSVNPNDTPILAARKKESYLRVYNRPSSSDGWHWLTGRQNEIGELARAIGFRYQYDSHSGQYAHAAGFVVSTPSGQVSRYFFGIDFSPNELNAALRDAGRERTGRFARDLLLLCFHYDPSTGKYSLAIIKTLRIAGVLTLLAIFGSIAFMSARKDTGGRTTQLSRLPYDRPIA